MKHADEDIYEFHLIDGEHGSWWHEYAPAAHDTYARYLLKQEVVDLEDTGWVRVWGKCKEVQWTLGFRDGLRLSTEQRAWLNRNDYRVEEWD